MNNYDIIFEVHELPFVENILMLSLQKADENGAKKVLSINLVIGKLSSIVDDSVEFYWQMLAKDTLCEGSKLNIKRIPAIINCLECGNHYEITDELMACPQCGSIRIKVIQGEEAYLDSIDIEK